MPRSQHPRSFLDTTIQATAHEVGRTVGSHGPSLARLIWKGWKAIPWWVRAVPLTLFVVLPLACWVFGAVAGGIGAGVYYFSWRGRKGRVNRDFKAILKGSFAIASTWHFLDTNALYAILACVAMLVWAGWTYLPAVFHPLANHKARVSAQELAAQQHAYLIHRLFAGTHALTGISPTVKAQTGLVPANPAPYVRLDGDGSVGLALAPHFQRGEERKTKVLETQVASLMGQKRMEADWGFNDWVWFRPAVALPERIDYKPGASTTTTFCLGVYGPQASAYRWDLKKAPHLLLSGGTGNGKSSASRVALVELLNQGHELIVIDPKGAEMEFLKGRRGVITVATDLEEAVEALRFAHAEMTARKAARKARTGTWGHLFIYIDETAHLVEEATARFKAGDEEHKQTAAMIHFYLGDIARLGRGFKVHLALAMQRPDATLLKGETKSNLNMRLAIGWHNTTDSQMVLDSTAANKDMDETTPKGRTLALQAGEMVPVQLAWMPNPYDDHGVWLPQVQAEMDAYLPALDMDWKPKGLVQACSLPREAPHRPDLEKAARKSAKPAPAPTQAPSETPASMSKPSLRKPAEKPAPAAPKAPRSTSKLSDADAEELRQRRTADREAALKDLHPHTNWPTWAPARVFSASTDGVLDSFGEPVPTPAPPAPSVAEEQRDTAPIPVPPTPSSGQRRRRTAA